jgi:hypothetical protein
MSICFQLIFNLLFALTFTTSETWWCDVQSIHDWAKKIRNNVEDWGLVCSYVKAPRVTSTCWRWRQSRMDREIVDSWIVSADVSGEICIIFGNGSVIVHGSIWAWRRFSRRIFISEYFVRARNCANVGLSNTHLKLSVCILGWRVTYYVTHDISMISTRLSTCLGSIYI